MIPLRLARELTYQLDKAREDERLTSVLSKIPVFLRLYRGEDRFDVLAFWKRLTECGHNPVERYRLMIAQARRSKALFLPEALQYISELSNERGEWEFSIELSEQLASWSEENNDVYNLIEALRALGAVHANKSAYNEAMEYLARAEHLARKHGYLTKAAKILGHIGNIHKDQGRYVEAIGCYERYLESAEAAGDSLGISFATQNMGIVHYNQGKYAEAVLCYEKDLRICELIGDRRRFAATIGNLGAIHMEQGRYEAAIECYQRSLRIAEELGNKQGASITIGNIGNVYQKQGRFPEAVEAQKKAILLQESLGSLRLLSISVGNLGSLRVDQGNMAEAIACFARQLKIAKTIGDKNIAAYAEGCLGEIYLKSARYTEAYTVLLSAIDGSSLINARYDLANWMESLARLFLEIAFVPSAQYPLSLSEQYRNEELPKIALYLARQKVEEGLRISEQLSIFDKCHACEVILVRIDAAEGNEVLATEKLEAMLLEITDEEQVADLHYWLWKITQSDIHQGEALECYVTLVERIPKFEFRKRIAELRGERVPISADDLEEAKPGNS